MPRLEPPDAAGPGVRERFHVGVWRKVGELGHGYLSPSGLTDSWASCGVGQKGFPEKIPFVAKRQKRPSRRSRYEVAEFRSEPGLLSVWFIRLLSRVDGAGTAFANSALSWIQIVVLPLFIGWR